MKMRKLSRGVSKSCFALRIKQQVKAAEAENLWKFEFQKKLEEKFLFGENESRQQTERDVQQTASCFQ